MPKLGDFYYFFHPCDSYKHPPVLLLHGAGGHHLSWPAEVRRMPAFRIFSLDLPGHGKSGGIGLQSIQDYADSVIQFMDAARLAQVVCVGHSMGGAIALMLGLEHAERIAGLCLVGTGARLRVAPAILEHVENSSTYSLAVQAMGSLLFSEQVDDHVKNQVIKQMTQTRPSVLHGDLLACNEFDVMDRLDALHIPTLILVGGEDKMAPPRFSEYLAEKIPGSKFEVITGAGHMVMLEKPRKIADGMSEFIRRIPYSLGLAL